MNLKQFSLVHTMSTREQLIENISIDNENNLLKEKVLKVR